MMAAPLVRRISPAIADRRDDLPEPTLPMTATSSPRFICKVISLRVKGVAFGVPGAGDGSSELASFSVCAVSLLFCFFGFFGVFFVFWLLVVLFVGVVFFSVFVVFFCFLVFVS